jgi:hypothetical protein
VYRRPHRLQFLNAWGELWPMFFCALQPLQP